MFVGQIDPNAISEGKGSDTAPSGTSTGRAARFFIHVRHWASLSLAIFSHKISRKAASGRGRDRTLNARIVLVLKGFLNFLNQARTVRSRI
jgi:hypothetical protein